MSLVLLKPNFLYDDDKKEYRGFGNTDGKTLLTLPIMAIILAIFIGMSFRKKNNPVQHMIPVQYYPIQPMMTNNYNPANSIS